MGTEGNAGIEGLDLKLDGAVVSVAVKMGNSLLGFKGNVIGWDLEKEVVVLKELADNGVATGKTLILPKENILYIKLETQG